MRSEIVHLIFGAREDKKEGGRTGWKEGGQGRGRGCSRLSRHTHSLLSSKAEPYLYRASENTSWLPATGHKSAAKLFCYFNLPVGNCLPCHHIAPGL